MAKAEEFPIFTRWMQFLEWLLPVTEKFPKRVRFTFADRINNLGALRHKLGRYAEAQALYESGPRLLR